MSRTNRDNELRNPATRFFEWSSNEKTLTWYDKEEKKNVTVELPFVFLVLDQLSTITGWSDNDQSGIWSNEIRDTRKDILTVRTKLGTKDVGLYEKVKHVPGARYTRSIYIAFKDGDELVLGHLKLKGAANSAWIEFTKSAGDIYAGAVRVTGAVEGKKGATVYYSPEFAMNSVSKETLDKADELDRQLQAYLSVYLARSPETEQAQTAAAGWSDGKAGRGDYSEPAEGYEPNFSGPPPDLDDEIPF